MTAGTGQSRDGRHGNVVPEDQRGGPSRTTSPIENDVIDACLQGEIDAVCRLFCTPKRSMPRDTRSWAALVYRGVVIPYAVRLWANKAYCNAPQHLAPGEKPVKFCKLTEMAGDMLGSLTLPSPGKVVVLFDSYYLCPAVIHACETRGFRYAGVVKKNRNFFPDGRLRDKRKLS